MGLHFWMMGWHMILVLVIFRYLCGFTSVTADETILSQEICGVLYNDPSLRKWVSQNNKHCF